MIDSIVFRLLHTKKDSSQQNVTSIINMYTNRTINRSNYVRREQSIDIETYSDLFKLINNFEPAFFGKYTTTIYAVDGTGSNMDIKLEDEGYSANKNNESVTSLILGVHNVTRNYPVALELVKHKDERKAVNDVLQKMKIPTNSIFVFDRGFYSLDLIDKLNSKKLKFVCRLKKNLIILDDDNNDYTTYVINNGIKHKLRIITYSMGGHEYYLATNLFESNEYSIKILKDIYHSRWTVEELFKLLKTNTDLNKFNEKNDIAIKKSLYCQLIIAKLSSYLEQCYTTNKMTSKNKKDVSKKINKSNLIQGIYHDFILHIFYKRTTMKFINKFIQSYVIIHTSAKGRSFERTSKRPYSKWYVKRYFKRYVKTEIT
ncbi:MAG TPA: transposase [Yeosuana sp.]